MFLRPGRQSPEFMGTKYSIIPLTVTMVSRGANANFNRPKPKSGHISAVAGCSLEGRLTHSGVHRKTDGNDRENEFDHRAVVKPIGSRQMPVIQWVARCWIQPIGRT